MRNSLFSQKIKRSEVRILIIDDNQIRYNKIIEILTTEKLTIDSILLDDLKNFEKQLQIKWDIIIFGQAYDLKLDQVMMLIQNTASFDIPVLILSPVDYQKDQYWSYINKGCYDVIDVEENTQFYIAFLRALSFSRLLQSQNSLLNELEHIQTQSETRIQAQHLASAQIQEGIHIQANPEYLELFDLKHEDELIGLPLLDILQPNDIQNFKQKFKKVAQGYFDHAAFEIESQHEHAQAFNPLKVEFQPSAQDNIIQLTVTKNQHSLITTPALIIDSEQQTNHPVNRILRTLKTQPAKLNALVIFSLADCPSPIFTRDWNTAKQYFSNIAKYIENQTSYPIFKINTLLVATILQSDSQALLQSKLTSLLALEKPQVLNIQSVNYPLHLKIGYTLISDEVINENNFEQLLALAFNTPLPQATHESSTLQLEPVTQPLQPSLEQPSSVYLQEDSVTIENNESRKKEQPQNSSFTAIQPTQSTDLMISELYQKLQSRQIQLKFQQLYDKQDSKRIYEVSNGFIFQDQWQDIQSLCLLEQHPNLNVQLSRWILSESCKQLLQFQTQYPDAALIINLHSQILFQDASFIEFIQKLKASLPSQTEFPLILQFNKNDILQHATQAKNKFEQLKQSGILVSLRDFNIQDSPDILAGLEIQFVQLQAKDSQMLDDPIELGKLQQHVEALLTAKPVEIILCQLNDMNLFANAWSVDSRYLQGDYFQKKLELLKDVQDQ